MLCCSDSTDHDRLLMRPIVEFFVHVLLPGSIIHRLTCVIIVLSWACCNLITINVYDIMWLIDEHFDVTIVYILLILI